MSNQYQIGMSDYRRLQVQIDTLKTLINSGQGGANSIIATAAETIAEGAIVNFNAVGLLNAYGATVADGYVIDPASPGDTVALYIGGMNNKLSGLTVGLDCFLDNSIPGAVSQIAPTLLNQVIQFLGKAVSDTTVEFVRGIPMRLSDVS